MNQPKTLDEAVNLIISGIDPIELEKTRELTKTMDLDEMAGRVHHTLGMFFRNKLHLWYPEQSGDLLQSIWDSLTPEKQDYYRRWWAGKGDYQGRTMHADDASHTLLVATLKRIKGD